MAWASALLVSCVLTACHNPESVRDHFDTAVLPVLEQRCGAAVCHGVAPGAEEAGDVIDWELLFWAVDGLEFGTLQTEPRADIASSSHSSTSSSTTV